MISPYPRQTTEIRDELEKIVGSRAFRDRETLRNLLEYLVDRTLDGTADNLKEYVIGVDVFGKPAGYDPQTDASVRVQIGKLRRNSKSIISTEHSRLGSDSASKAPFHSFHGAPNGNRGAAAKPCAGPSRGVGPRGYTFCPGLSPFHAQDGSYSA